MSNRRVDLAEGFTLAVRGMKRTRHEYKKAVRRMYHPITHLPTALPSLSAARIFSPPHPHCVSAGKQRRRGFFVIIPSSGCLTFGLSTRDEAHQATPGDAADSLVRNFEIAGGLTMRRASVETVDHRGANVAKRLTSSACSSPVAIDVFQSCAECAGCKGQHRCPID